MPSHARHRQLLVVRGERAETVADAAALVKRLPVEGVLWVGSEDVPFVSMTARAVRRSLGRSFHAVVLDLHDGLDADLLGQSHGFVWGGGALVLRLPPAGDTPTIANGRFSAHPYQPEDVGSRFWDRFSEIVDRHSGSIDEPLRPAPTDVSATADQDAVVARLSSALGAADRPATVVVLADRGRGKSAAVGRALASTAGRIAVTAGHRDAVGEVFRFALGDPEPGEDGRVCWRDAWELVRSDESFDVIVVDEAAQLPAPVLQALVRRRPRTSFVFATTVHGYEGTGRGFQLRFLEWLRARRAVEQLELAEPIRWDSGDPLENVVFDALLLDAEPSDIVDVEDLANLRHEVLDRDALVRDEALLRAFFGLLIQAHYRTTPGDLHRMLDAPNLDLHALFDGERVVAASLVAREGAWPAALAKSVYHGERRVRGHALPETLVSHLGHPDSSALTMVRSVRIAVHPGARRRGVGSALVEAVESSYSPELFGTMFGATPDLIAFRRQLGYRVVRLSSSRGARTGEPSVVMLKPTASTADLVHQLRAEFSRDVDLQLALLAVEDELVDLARLAETLREFRAEPAALAMTEAERCVAHYTGGPRTYESAATAVQAYVETHADLLGSLEPTHNALIEARTLGRRSWQETADHAGLHSVPAAMRAMRRAVRELETRVSDRDAVASQTEADPQAK